MRYSGVVHMHSTYSYDGKLTLSELKALLVAEGVSFACMTEHTNEMTHESAAAFVAECRALSDESFVFVPGFEVPYKDPKVYHVLMIGATEFVGQFAREAQSLRDWASRASLVVLPHPVRNKFIYDEILLELADGLEIWNQQYDGKRVPRTRSYALLKALRKDAPELLATGGLDLHRGEHFTFPRYAIELDELTEDAILTALKAGRYTFGNEAHTIAATGEWEAASSFAVRSTSFCSTAIIFLSKKINKGLAALGLSLPKSLKRTIRARI